ncbi:MAG: dienelactone hydrolase family protein [Blastochloris sp.]|nr:dienelactone hydrolase family protein [Blastochloris sp.]
MKFFLSLLLLMTLSLTWAQDKTPVATGKQTGDMIFLRDYGTDDTGYLVVPEKQPSAGIVMLPDRYGITPKVKEFCAELAREGYLVLCLDIYNGRTAKTEIEAEQMAAMLFEKNIRKTLRTGLKFFEASPRFQMEKKVVIAWGATDQLAVRCAANEKDLYGLVLIYPSHAPEQEQMLDLKTSLYIQIPEDSPNITSFRALEPELTNRLRKNFELKILPRDSGETIATTALHTFIQQILIQPKTDTLLEKIF